MFTISSWVCGRGFGRSASLRILRNSQAIAVVCASQPIPNRIPHAFIRDHEHVLSQAVPWRVESLQSIAPGQFGKQAAVVELVKAMFHGAGVELGEKIGNRHL